jgi:hypothetical protein
MNDMDYYTLGYLKKCAEYGISPNDIGLHKQSLPLPRSNVLDFAKKLVSMYRNLPGSGSVSGTAGDFGAGLKRPFQNVYRSVKGYDDVQPLLDVGSRAEMLGAMYPVAGVPLGLGALTALQLTKGSAVNYQKYQPGLQMPGKSGKPAQKPMKPFAAQPGKQPPVAAEYNTPGGPRSKGKDNIPGVGNDFSWLNDLRVLSPNPTPNLQDTSPKPYTAPGTAGPQYG